MTLLIRANPSPDPEGRVLATRDALRHCAMEVFQLAPGAELARIDDVRETCLVLLSGQGRLEAEGLTRTAIGGRKNPFTAAGHAAYIPARNRFRFRAETDCELALCLAADERGKIPPRIIGPRSWQVSTRGAGSTARLIRDILPETEPAASLLVVEVITPGGHWSSFPPHKHDTDDWPHETALEEVYYHRFARPSGFGVQRVYTKDRSLDAALPLDDGCAVLVPRGYHPVSAAPGCDLYYLNVMAGPRRLWRVRVDTDHAAATENF
ncbi:MULTISPECIES: 5-deoxy-glucuronate isomerase [Acidiphilium]|uniref:5-deoxy-glucuronate isomerase n=1 Tax=Acidiphilium iwatense TaxID=768198 RepID=A0ABS9DZF4_9PROT|nr:MULTISPECIES: 5-deoxy-glucuronate isomerase [Acidiphilium]MCF3948127.1 5-deoxy-glucuronate isomerase [Acidiphilium iwatense]